MKKNIQNNNVLPLFQHSTKKNGGGKQKIINYLVSFIAKSSSLKTVILFLFLGLLLIPSVFATTQPCTTGGDQLTYGNGSWIGYVYGTHNGGNPPSDAFTTTYRGYVTNTENFNMNWGNDGPTCATSYDKFAIRYLMVKNYPAGVYKITIGADDGCRVYVGNSAITTLNGFTGLTYGASRWSNNSYGTVDYVFEWQGGDMYIDFEYYEQGSSAQSSFNICYEGPLQDYGTTSWNGYYYNTIDYNNTSYAGRFSSGFYTTNTVTDMNRATGSSAPPLDAAPSGTTACTASSSATNFATRFLLKNNFTRSFYLFTVNSDDGVRVSSQGPNTWTLGAAPSSWDIFNNWKTNGTYSNQNVTALLDGNKNLVIEHGQGVGNWGIRNQICQMNGNYTLGTYPIWNAYVFDNGAVDFKKYRGWFTTQSSGTTLIDNNFSNAVPANSATGTGVSNYTGAGCGFTAPASAADFSIRYVTRRNYTDPGIYVFNTLNNDDGRRLYIDYGAIGSPQQIYDNLSSNNGNTITSPILLNSGNNDFYYDFRAGGTPNRANFNECQMDGGGPGAKGNATTYGTNNWRIYDYASGNYNFNIADYRGTFTTGTVSSSTASFGEFSDGQIASNSNSNGNHPHVSGVLYDVGGNAASAVQFFITDSVRHFLRGSLYFYASPNADSIAPAVDYFRKDVEHIIKTIAWK